VQPRNMSSDRPGDDAARFLHELRELRDVAGLDVAELAARAHYPRDVLEAAEAGPTLPELPVLAAYVRGCGGTPAEWEDRWRSLTRAAESEVGLPTRQGGASAASAAGARAGTTSVPPEDHDPARIMAALTKSAAEPTRGGAHRAPSPAHAHGESASSLAQPASPSAPDLPPSADLPSRADLSSQTTTTPGSFTTNGTSRSTGVATPKPPAEAASLPAGNAKAGTGYGDATYGTTASAGSGYTGSAGRRFGGGTAGVASRSTASGGAGRGSPGYASTARPSSAAQAPRSAPPAGHQAVGASRGRTMPREAAIALIVVAALVFVGILLVVLP
jgi:hypothetical protein